MNLKTIKKVIKENWELWKAWEMGYWETQWASVVSPNAFARVLLTLPGEDNVWHFLGQKNNQKFVSKLHQNVCEAPALLKLDTIKACFLLSIRSSCKIPPGQVFHDSSLEARLEKKETEILCDITSGQLQKMPQNQWDTNTSERSK